MSEEAWRDYSSISGHPGFSSANSGSIGCNFDKLILLTSQSPLPIQTRTIIWGLESPLVLLTRLTLYGPIKLNANIMQQILDILCTNTILYIGFNMTRAFGLKQLKLVCFRDKKDGCKRGGIRD